ncbi:uncharacterized protein JCM15063_003032 [Sporobolomyces koalae]|uniref:uncharacterized protein n=1 Tax=Sporobolomyces koalae TaxID=500713 RepID=UPI003175A313
MVLGPGKADLFLVNLVGRTDACGTAVGKLATDAGQMRHRFDQLRSDLSALAKHGRIADDEIKMRFEFSRLRLLNLAILGKIAAYGSQVHVLVAFDHPDARDAKTTTIEKRIARKNRNVRRRQRKANSGSSKDAGSVENRKASVEHAQDGPADQVGMSTGDVEMNLDNLVFQSLQPIDEKSSGMCTARAE